MSEDCCDRPRRTLLKAAAIGLMLPSWGLAQGLSTTPRQTAGPFYPEELPLDDDADLTWVDSRTTRARGEHTDIEGRILDVNGGPLRDTRIEIWQCDASGYYRHRLDRGGKDVDPNFQGHGHALSDDNGAYRFRTIKPVPYPGRTPHIHMAVFPRGQRPFVTQLYVAGDPRNEDDFLYLSVPAEKRHLVQAEFSHSAGPGHQFSARFDLILDITPSSPA